MKKRLSKIIEEAKNRRANADKAKVLQDNDSPQLRELLAYAVNPNIHFKLPEGTPPYTPTDGINLEEKLYNSLRKLENCVGIGGNNAAESQAVKKMPLLQRERVFIDMLEEVHPQDAKLLVNVKDKDIGLKASVVKQAFPNHFQF